MDFINRIKFWQTADRIGPDIPLTHWQLHFKSSMVKLCQKKFKHFDESADFRPYAYAIWCSRISIGKRVVVRPNTMLCASPPEFKAGNITIEDDVLLAGGIQIHTDTHKFDEPGKLIIEQGYLEAKDVVLKKGCWIGANVTILQGVTIGENAVVGAGSVVTRNIPARSVAAGIPARVIRNLD